MANELSYEQRLHIAEMVYLDRMDLETVAAAHDCSVSAVSKAKKDFRGAFCEAILQNWEKENDDFRELLLNGYHPNETLKEIAERTGISKYVLRRRLEHYEKTGFYTAKPTFTLDELEMPTYEELVRDVPKRKTGYAIHDDYTGKWIATSMGGIMVFPDTKRALHFIKERNLNDAMFSIICRDIVEIGNFDDEVEI
jgi:DNA-binding Lrp family transcriptional regulator